MPTPGTTTPPTDRTSSWTAATVLGWSALAGITGSVVLFVVTGALGPSVAQPPLGPRTGLPPYSLQAEPDPWTVVTLLTAALVVGACGLAAGMLALRRGWQPPLRGLLVGSTLAVVAFVLVPPMGSADHLSYAAYGRLAALGHDPYDLTPEQAANGGDPVSQAAAEHPWSNITSVYGPVATAEQELASRIGGTSVRMTVLALASFNAAAYLLTTLLLFRLARGDPARRSRVALFWAANPLLLYAAVSGIHVDTLMVALLVASVFALRRSAPLAGVLLGTAMAVKLPAALGALGITWALQRRFRALVAAGFAALVVFAGLYYTAGPHAFDQLRRASKYVSLATPGRLLADHLEPLLGFETARLLLRAAGYAGMLVLGALILYWGQRRFGGTELGPVSDAKPPGPEVRQRLAVWMTGALCIGWLFTAPYALPWYDAYGWAFLALFPASRLDGLFLLRGVVLALAYVPGRTGLPDDVAHLTMGFRTEVAPYLTTALLVAAAVIVVRLPGRRPPVPPT